MDFIKDDLGRQKFADVLGNVAANLATAHVCPAGRVIAVDAPWGSGKSWVAKRLPMHFENDSKIGACVYVDAFKFDYHQDPFAVVTSAILDCFAESTPQKSQLKRAAIDVFKASLPILGKGLVRVGAHAVGLDADKIQEVIAEGAADASEKAIEKSLNTFTETKATTEAFQTKLESLALAGENGAPLVVVIDELDRCRPSYALEMLERIKHLFDVKNVVFIFFVHAPALHSAIRKTYGLEIDPTEYLRKFISVTINLPISERPAALASQQKEFLQKFLNAQYPIAAHGVPMSEHNFRSELVVLATAFNASFRDIEAAMLLSTLLKDAVSRDPACVAYCFLLKIREQSRIKELKANSWQAFQLEFERLDQHGDHDDVTIDWFKKLFLFAAGHFQPKKNGIQTLNPADHEMIKQVRYFHQVLISIELEHIRI